jgi:hypothetical protein
MKNVALTSEETKVIAAILAEKELAINSRLETLNSAEVIGDSYFYSDGEHSFDYEHKNVVAHFEKAIEEINKAKATIDTGVVAIGDTINDKIYKALTRRIDASWGVENSEEERESLFKLQDKITA